VPALPGVGEARAGAAIRIAEAAGARGLTCSASTWAARSRTWWRSATGGSRSPRSPAIPTGRPARCWRALAAWASREARCSTTPARWASTRSSPAGCRRSPSSPPTASATCSTGAACGGRSTPRPTRPGGAPSGTPRARSSRATCGGASPSGHWPTAPRSSSSTRRTPAGSSQCSSAARWRASPSA
jgi:hypothetical protein